MAATADAAVGAILERAVEAGRLSGAVAMAADAAGEVCSVVAGLSDPHRQAAMQRDTLFRIASMTKPVTAVAAMQLVERGLLDLDRPVGEVLPELAAPMVLLPPGPDGQPRLQPATRPITLRHLLTHTAGFGYEMWNASLRHHSQATGLPRAISGKLAALNAPLMREPGEQWEYGINIDWAGRMVEAVSGEALPDYFEQHIFAPLAMHDTTYDPDDAQSRRLAVLHRREPDGSLQPVPTETRLARSDREFTPGGGGLFSTGPDYLRFLRMLLSHGSLEGSTILSRETVATMGENHIGALDVVPLRTAMPALSNDVDLFPGTEKKWGLSFLRTTQALRSGRGAGSLCWAGLYNTSFWIDPANGLTGLFMTQISPFADQTVLDVAEAAETAIYAERGRSG